MEALADFYVAYKFLRVQQDAYIDTVLGMGGLKKYIALVRRTSLHQFVTEFLTTEEQAHFLVQVLIDRLEGEVQNDEFNVSGTAA